MKSYTDIEQSKLLAKILPLESADMGYLWNSTSFCEYPVSSQTIFKKVENIPCWSLATLLSVLDFPSLTQNKEDEWEVCVPNHKSDGYIDVSADNPVDACVEMILKLRRLNLS